MLNLTSEKALIFRILHKDNLASLFQDGILCRRRGSARYRTIGNEELINRRHTTPVPIPPGGTLSDYIPFYFTPKSIMLYNIITGWGGITRQDNSDIIFLVSSLRLLYNQQRKFLFTDRHAVLATAKFFSELSALNQIDWDILRDADFRQDYNNPEKKERYQCEALVHDHLPCASLNGIACFNDAIVAEVQGMLDKAGLQVKVLSRPNWYFS